MKRLFLTMLVAIMPAISALSQDWFDCDLSSRWEEDGSATIFAETKACPGTISLCFDFSKNVNLANPGKVFILREHNKDKIVNLKKVLPERSSSLSYSYQYMFGDAEAKVDENFVYMLPVPDKKAYKVAGPNDKSYWNILVEEQDTVYTARAGLVVKVDDGNISQVMYEGFVQSKNSIFIEHKDGTIAQYFFIDDGSSLVHEGQYVAPRTAIALAGHYDSYNYRVGIALAKPEYDKASKKLVNKKIPMLFRTDEGDVYLESNKSYKPVISDELITAEMSKKEKARYYKK